MRSFFKAHVIVLTGLRSTLQKEEYDPKAERFLWNDILYVTEQIKAGKFGGKPGTKTVSLAGYSYGTSLSFNAMFRDSFITSAWLDGIFWNQRMVINGMP